jgi:dTDP-4-amino-4,6-dideoxygalactose transaminase
MMMREISFSPPDISECEISEVVETMKSGWITTGPKSKRFETELTRFCGADKTVCLNSATAALELTLRVLGIGTGDEVITSAYTYTASASVIAHVGAKIVLVDTAPDSYEMDDRLLEAAVTEKTKAVIAPDIAGVMCDYSRIKAILDGKRSLFTPTTSNQQAIGRAAVIADAAHSLGAVRDGMKSGCAADFTCFSFHAVKNVTTAEGGAVTWKTKEGISDGELYRQFMLLALHGQNKDAFSKAHLGGWEYDVECLGYKFNMTDIAAAIGSAQLKRYPELLRRRRELVTLYGEGLRGLPCSAVAHITDNGMSSMHLYLVRVTGIGAAQRNAIILKLAESGISASVHYKPLPMMTAYIALGFNIADYPNAYRQYQNEITLPLHTLLSDDDARYVIEQFKACIGAVIDVPANL